MNLTEARRLFPARSQFEKMRIAERTRCHSTPHDREPCRRLGDLSYTHGDGRLILAWCLRCLVEWLTELETNPYEEQLTVQRGQDRVFIFERVGDVST